MHLGPGNGSTLRWGARQDVVDPQADLGLQPGGRVVPGGRGETTGA
jgi:hypothetical protein